MFFGGLAFALAPLLGRSGSAGVAGIVMVLLWVASGLDVGGPLVDVSPFHWTVNHIPLVGVYDWPGLAARRGRRRRLPRARCRAVQPARPRGDGRPRRSRALPGAVLGVRGPVSRAFGDQLPRALAWGIGMGLFGALLASLVGPFAEQIGSDTSLAKIFATIFPGYDLATAGGWLQLYVALFYIAAGFAGGDVRLEVGVGRDRRTGSRWSSRLRCRAPAG